MGDFALPRRDVLALLPAVLAALILSALSQGIIVTALPAIGRALRESERLPWMMTAYLMAGTVTIPLFGKLSDIWGRRRILLIALAIFVAGSTACAVSPTMAWLIISRGVQGAGGGALISLCLTVMADAIPPRERASYQVIVTLFYTAGNLGGPILGGFIVQHLDWRAVFWVNVPLGGLAILLCAVALRKLPQNHRHRPLDITGALMLSAATVFLLLTINGEQSGRTLAVIAGASAGFWLLFGCRLLRASSPLIDLHLLMDPLIRNATVSGSLSMAALVGMTVYFPVYMEIDLDLSASGSGVALMPLIIGSTTGGIIAGQIMPRYGRYRRIAAAGLVLAGVSLLGMAACVGAHAPLWILEGVMLLAGIGIGTVPPITTISAQNASVPSELGTVTALINYVRQLGSTVFVALMGAVISNAGIKGSLEGGPEDHRAILAAFTSVFATAGIATLAALFFLLRMEERPLRSSLSEQPKA